MIPQTLGGRLRKLRKDRGLEQEELSKKLGYSKRAISSWETGLHIPDLLATTIIAQYFEISLDYLVLGIREGDNYGKRISS